MADRLPSPRAIDTLPAVPGDDAPTAPPSGPPLAGVAVWGARMAWLAVAVLGGRAVGVALADHGGRGADVLTVAAWAGWAVGAVALAVPATVTLTTARVVVPGAVAVAVAAAVGGADAGQVLALAGPAVIATVLTASGDLGRRWVQASAYGDEQRFPLRPPVGYLTAAVLAWVLWTGVTLGAVIALADQRVAIGLALTVLAAAGMALLPRRWHQLSLRWLVTVPAGLVVHDPVVLGETLMVSRRQIARLTITDLSRRSGHTAADLTGPTAGTAIEVTLNESVTALFSPQPGLPQGKAIHMTAFLVAPSRPGAVLTDARRRRLPLR